MNTERIEEVEARITASRVKGTGTAKARIDAQWQLGLASIADDQTTVDYHLGEAERILGEAEAVNP